MAFGLFTSSLSITFFLGWEWGERKERRSWTFPFHCYVETNCALWQKLPSSFPRINFLVCHNRVVSTRLFFSKNEKKNHLCLREERKGSSISKKKNVHPQYFFILFFSFSFFHSLFFILSFLFFHSSLLFQSESTTNQRTGFISISN